MWLVFNTRGKSFLEPKLKKSKAFALLSTTEILTIGSLHRCSFTKLEMSPAILSLRAVDHE